MNNTNITNFSLAKNQQKMSYYALENVLLYFARIFIYNNYGCLGTIFQHIPYLNVLPCALEQSQCGKLVGKGDVLSEDF